MGKIKLYNGVVYALTDYATPNHFVLVVGNMNSFEILETLTEENLAKIQFLTDNNSVTGTYHNKLLCGHTDNGDTLAVDINDADLCRYGLVLDEDNRIIDAPFQRYAPADAVIVDSLPEGNLPDYRYVDGDYVYDPSPIPEPEDPTPTLENRVETLETDSTEIKEALEMILSGVTE